MELRILLLKIIGRVYKEVSTSVVVLNFSTFPVAYCLFAKKEKEKKLHSSGIFQGQLFCSQYKKINYALNTVE